MRQPIKFRARISAPASRGGHIWPILSTFLFFFFGDISLILSVCAHSCKSKSIKVPPCEYLQMIPNLTHLEREDNHTAEEQQEFQQEGWVSDRPGVSQGK